MIKHILLGLTAGIALLPAPVAAQRQEKVVVVYGTDKCPTNAAGQEVVVCARRPESERYRIPSELRESNETQSSGARVSAMAAGGTAGSTTCSNIGGGGGSNCFGNQMRAARAEKKQAKTAAAASPMPQ